MTGRWHECGCGCGYSHKVIDGRIICPHPNFLDMLGPGELFVLDPTNICQPCVFELEQVLEAAAVQRRRALSSGREPFLAGLDAVRAEFDEQVDSAQVEAMFAEGGAVWERET